MIDTSSNIPESSDSKGVNTAWVKGRRKLSFDSLDDVLVELSKLEAVSRDGGSMVVLGNWSVGQIFAHLAVPMNGAIDGMNISMPWHMRMLARMLKPIVLRMKMPAGFKLPENAKKVMEPGPTSFQEGLDQLRNAIARLKSNSHREPHPVLGPINEDEWNRIMCRHCELHLSFILPEA